MADTPATNALNLPASLDSSGNLNISAAVYTAPQQAAKNFANVLLKNDASG